MIKLLVIVMLLLIVGSLFSALFYLIKDKGQGQRTIRALTWRISLSIVLFILLLISFKLGLIGQPTP